MPPLLLGPVLANILNKALPIQILFINNTKITEDLKLIFLAGYSHGINMMEPNRSLTLESSFLVGKEELRFSISYEYPTPMLILQ